jgi:hypothetical protein
MNKLIAWLSIIIITIIAGYYLLNRQPIQLQTFMTYTEPGAYSISYPVGWMREEQGRTIGSEILALYSYDYRNPEVVVDRFGPGQIKITVGILAKSFKSFDQIVDSQFTGTKKDYREELLHINGRQAIRISPLFKPTGGSSSRIDIYIDYTDDQYALVTGYYNGDENGAAIIRRVQESFQK